MDNALKLIEDDVSHGLHSCLKQEYSILIFWLVLSTIVQSRVFNFKILACAQYNQHVRWLVSGLISPAGASLL